ncbi:peptidoglycan -binding protein [Reyranella sp.]|uniref:peptidoglycan -binding protein n=1 Tax=Reyranella sp. TaxID=1929291 RepID=UPI003D120B41
MAAISRRREGAADYTWPGYVDALTTLLMVLIFLLSIFSVAQFTLSTVLTNRESAIDTLNRQISDIASQLSLEKRSAEDLQKDVSRLTLLTRELQTERERLNVDLASQRRTAEDLRAERERLNTDLAGQRKSAEELRAERERLNTDLAAQRKSAETLRTDRDRLNTDLAAQRKTAEELKAERDRVSTDLAAQRKSIDEATAERDRLSTLLRDATREIETKTGDMQKEIERQRLELTRLAASLAAANNEKGKLFADLTEEQKQTAEQKATAIRLTTEVAGLRDELARLGSLLDAADTKAKQQQAQIVDLGQKLNRALASKVEELARYRSEFFGKLREALAGQRDVQIVGDRFVFQSEVLFPSGSAQLQPGGEKQLASVAQRLVEIASKIPKDINWVLQVDGHTDNKPIKSAQFPSNWELSTARAIAVVKFLNEQGIANENLVAAGYGEYQPLSSTDTARNRRIELKLTNR